MASILPWLMPQFFDSNGDPLAGGKLYSYIAGTTTPLSTYADQAGVVPNQNPVILDSNGMASIYMGGGSYKFVLKDANDVVQWTKDNISADDEGGGDDQSGWTEHAITDGQAAADLTGETLDLELYSSAFYDAEITRGTTVIANGQFAIQNLNGTARVVEGVFIANEAHGVTFSVTQADDVAQLRAETTSGPGAGAVKLTRRLAPA